MTFRFWLLAVALAWLLPGFAATQAAEAVPGVDIDSIRVWLLSHNPQLRAAQVEAEAADARVLPAGALPDPMLALELEEIDPEQRSLLPGNVGSTTYRLTQRFPLWGKRELSRQVARSSAEALHFERDAQALELLAKAEAAYVRYWHAREALTITDRLLALLDQVEAVAVSRYGVGLAAQQDAIRAQVERTQLRRDRIERLAVQQEASALLNAALGRRADQALAEPSAPPRLPVIDDTLDAALQRLDSGGHPALQASNAMAAAANREVSLQRRNRWPDLSLGVGAMQRGNRIDSYELMLEVDIPFQQRARRERERASRLLEEAALARSEATRRDLQGELGIAWARWRAAREQHRLISQTLLPQAEAVFNSALASYPVGAVDFLTLLDALRQWQGADLARLDAQRDELLAAANLRAIAGEPQ